MFWASNCWSKFCLSSLSLRYPNVKFSFSISSQSFNYQGRAIAADANHSLKKLKKGPAFYDISSNFQEVLLFS